MNWFAWRQHRKQFMILGIILAIYAAVVIPTGLHFWHTYTSTLAACAHNPATPGCSDLSSNLFQSTFDQLLLRFVPLACVLLPLLLGVFWGAPLLAREYNEGTNSLAWTQSISRRKWLTIKLAWMLFATIVFMGAFAALNTWWSKTSNAINLNRFDSGLDYFPSQGIVPIGYGLFAVSVSIMFGAWFRKTLASAGVLLFLFFAVVLIAVPFYVRPHYMTPVTVTAPMGPGKIDSKIPAGAWVVSTNIVDKNGKTFNSFNLADMPSQCQEIIQQQQAENGRGGIRIKVAPGNGDPIDACLNKAGFHQIATYQPSYRYWDFQRIEAGIYLGLTVLSVGATYWVVLKRDA